MTELDLTALLDTGRAAVDAAVHYVHTHPITEIRGKGGSEVTNIDPAVEALVRERLCTHPDLIGFLGEETGPYGTADNFWVLDPIDGTLNFAHGLPIYAIALGLVRHDRPLLGVVAMPALQRTYWATRGAGAFRDGTPIHVSATTQLSQALVGLSDYGNGHTESSRDKLSTMLDRALTRSTRQLRRIGSTAAELAFVADGGLDASITIGNRPWDTAAGAVIAAEAGAALLDMDGTPHTTQSQCAIAITPGLTDDILRLLTNA